LWNVVRNDPHTQHAVVTSSAAKTRVAAAGRRPAAASVFPRNSLTQQNRPAPATTVAATTISFTTFTRNGQRIEAALAAARPQVVVVNHPDHTFWLELWLPIWWWQYENWDWIWRLPNRLAKQALLTIPIDFT
jgi:hypothetical protein